MSQEFCPRGAGVSQHALGQTPPCPVHAGIHTPWADTPQADPRTDTPPPAAPATDGTHPTGMHSCFQRYINIEFDQIENCKMFILKSLTVTKMFQMPLH